MNKVKIKQDNKIYFITPAEDNPRESNGDNTANFMYRVEDENEEVIGCIVFTWARTARSTASHLVFRSNPEEEIAYLALLPHLPFFPDLVKSIYTTCFRYVFNTMTDGLESDKSGYSIKVEGGFMRTMQRFIFSGQPTDDQVRRQILIALHNHWLTDPYTSLPLPIVNLFVPVDMQTLVRNAIFLIGEDLIEPVMRPSADPPVIETIKIKNNGIKHVEDQSEFSVKFASEIVYQKFMGHQINASTTGNNSPIIIDSQNINIAFNEIKTKVEKKDTADKKELLKLLDELNTEITNNKRSDKIVETLNKIKGVASWVNDELLSHPLLATLLATAMAEKLGISG